MLDEFRSLPLVWDKANSRFLDTLELNASDENGRKLTVQVLDDGQVVNLTGANLALYWESDGGQYEGLDGFTPIDASKGLFELFFTTGMLSNKGKVTGWLRLQDTTGVTISTPLVFNIGRGIDNAAVESESSFTVLTEALNEVLSVNIQEQARQDNESVRIASENLRKQAENNRNSQYQTAEAERFSQYRSAEQQRLVSYAPELTQMQTNINNLQSESGSNSKGSWVKRPDGTMETVTTVTIPAGALTAYGSLFYKYATPRNIDFPQSFDGAPSLSFSTNANNWFFAWGNVTPTSLIDLIGYRPTGGSIPEATIVTVRAHGYWDSGITGGTIPDVGVSRYPAYWKQHIDSKINEVKNLQSSGLDAHSFGFITDMHIQTNHRHSPLLLKEFVDRAGVEVIINGGDQYSNGINTTKAQALGFIRDVLDISAPIKDQLMYTMANHDDNSISLKWLHTLKDAELYSELFRYMGNNSIYGPTGKYHYRDNVLHKTRYIVLDAIDIPYIQAGEGLKYRGQHDYVFRQEQLDWFANVALNTPNRDWSVVVVSHIPPFDGGITGFDAPIANANIARGILKAYKEKKSYAGNSTGSTPSDFYASVNADYRGSNKGGDVIVWLSGHVHYDNAIQLPEGFPMVTTNCDSYHKWTASQPDRASGTTTEHSFDIITVNKAQRKMYFTRVGAGVNRTVSY